MTVKLSGALPREESQNGLNTITVEQRIARDNSQPLVAVMVLRPHDKREELDDGAVTWTVRAERVEVLDPTDQAETVKAALRMLSEAAEDRTGEKQLDYSEELDTSTPWGEDSEGSDAGQGDDDRGNVSPFRTPGEE